MLSWRRMLGEVDGSHFHPRPPQQGGRVPGSDGVLHLAWRGDRGGCATAYGCMTAATGMY